MPIYVYRCEFCYREFERIQRIADPPMYWCPVCRDFMVHRVPQPVSIAFKGSGFHVNDYPKEQP